jgi:hypothetical protein
MAAPHLEHEVAEQRLEAALAAQHELMDHCEAAAGEPAALVAEDAVHAADQEVRARDAWLRWIDDSHYHGLNAGPFELRLEAEGTLGIRRPKVVGGNATPRHLPELQAAVEAALGERERSDWHRRSQRKALHGGSVAPHGPRARAFDTGGFPMTPNLSGLARRVGRLMRDARTP